jgi:hypothetical protein
MPQADHGDSDPGPRSAGRPGPFTGDGNGLECKQGNIIIAHRLSTIRDAHKIIVMDRGHVANNGRHDMLMRCCAAYRRLVARQMFLPERSA